MSAEGRGAAPSRAALARLDRAIARASEVLAHAGMVLISIFIALQIADIAGRKSVGFTIFGLSEIGQLLVMGCICLSLPFVFAREGHIAVEFVTDRLRPGRLAAVKFAVALATLVCVAALAYFGFRQAAAQILKGDASPTLTIPVLWYWLPLLLGLTASAAACASRVAACALAALAGADPGAGPGAPAEPGA